MSKRLIILSALLLVLLHAQCQKQKSVSEQLNQLEMEMDSLSIFLLIDSLLELEVQAKPEFIARTGFNSSLVYAGRNYGINQQSYNIGASYYHPSGLFADLSGYFNSGLSPRYNLTIGSVGYIGIIGKQFAYSGSYERWIYNINESASEFTVTNSLNNSLNNSFSYSNKHISGSIDYNFLFGKEMAHRIMATISSPWKLSSSGFLRHLSIQPSASIIFGNQTITQYRYSESNQAKLILNLLTLDQSALVRLLNSEKISAEQYTRLVKLRDALINGSLTPKQEARLSEVLYESYNENQFGLMNMIFTLPVMFSLKQFSMLLSYSYSVPFELTELEETLDPIGYFGTSISYRISLK